MLELSLKLIGKMKTRTRQDPIVRVAIEQYLSDMGELDGGSVCEEEVAEAHVAASRIEGGEVLSQIRPLDELLSVLLLDRHEHPQDVAQQVAAALRDAVEEQGLS